MTAVRITLLNLEVSLCRTAEDGAATDICCGPLGMKRAAHVIRPRTMTRTNTTGSADDMAVTVASERLSEEEVNMRGKLCLQRRSLRVAEEVRAVFYTLSSFVLSL
jgi:hypothetical protein